MGQKSNSSIESENTRLVVYVFPMINDYQKHIFSIVNYIILCGVVSVFGTVANVINMVIFYRLGLDSTTNISFFAMAVSDLCCLIAQHLFNFYINPLCQNLHLPMIYTDVQYITSGVPREVFARITCLITVYITAERCLCVAFPLHIKQMITTKTTGVVMFAICAIVFVCSTPLFMINQLEWHYYPEYNRTLLGIVMSQANQEMYSIIYPIHAFVGLLSFLAVIVFTVNLIMKLKEKNTWRKTVSVQQDKSASVSSRERATVVTVVLVASILIICNAPATLLAVTTVLVPEFNVGGTYYNMYYVVWSFAFLLGNINSSVNIFLYLKMSSKYRQDFQYLFFSQGKTAKPTRS